MVLGLTGEKGSGKETFVKLLAELNPNQGITHLRSSDILRETLQIWSIPETRTNLQLLPVIMTPRHLEKMFYPMLFTNISKMLMTPLLFLME